MTSIRIIQSPINRDELKKIAQERFGDMAKVVVDLERKVFAIGGEMHADEEQTLLDDGSSQNNLWGINLYPEQTGDNFIEFDSMINIRPSQGNRSRGVESEETQARIRELITALIH